MVSNGASTCIKKVPKVGGIKGFCPFRHLHVPTFSLGQNWESTHAYLPIGISKGGISYLYPLSNWVWTGDPSLLSPNAYLFIGKSKGGFVPPRSYPFPHWVWTWVQTQVHNPFGTCRLRGDMSPPFTFSHPTWVRTRAPMPLPHMLIHPLAVPGRGDVSSPSLLLTIIIYIIMDMHSLKGQYRHDQSSLSTGYGIGVQDEHSDWGLLAHLCTSNGNMTLSCGVLIAVTELI